MRKCNGYGGYRGGPDSQRFLKILALLLSVILVLVLVAFLVLPNFFVYTDGGVKLELPWSKNAPEPSSPLPTESVLVVATPAPTPAPTPSPRAAADRLVALPVDTLTDGTAAAALTAAGGNGAIFDMKADNGTLAYLSALPLALESKASGDQPGANQTITETLAQLPYAVARVSCFRDQLLSGANPDLNIRSNSGYLWADGGKIRWTNPSHQAVRDYVTAVCVELAALGFDEILLDNASYPPSGQLGYIRKNADYDATQFEANITAFYAQVQDALKDDSVTLSVVADEEIFRTGVNKKSGQGIAAVSTSAGRVYVPGGVSWPAGTDLLQQLHDNGFQGTRADLITLSKTSLGQTGYSWAVLP